MNAQLWTSIGWVIAACALGFAITAIFTWRLKLPRNRFLIPYVGLVGLFLWAFLVLDRIDAAGILRKNWAWGVVIGLLVSIVLIRNVQLQPRSRQADGAGLALDLTWPGLIYGLTDGLFLSVMPVVAMSAGLSQFGWSTTMTGKIGVGLIGLLASLLVAVAYHLGYPEFHGERMRFVWIGNGIITLAFLVSGNPLASMISHAVMHMAAVLQGAETTVQLPPHYQATAKAG
jgi:hypothetical protein